MRNLGDLSVGKCLIRYFKDRGRCMNIRKQVLPVIWQSKRNFLQNPRRGKWPCLGATWSMNKVWNDSLDTDMMMKTLWMMIHSAEWWHRLTFGQTLGLMPSDQILAWRLTEMTKFDLNTSKSLCKSIFDHWWRAFKTDTNTKDNMSALSKQESK